MPYRALLSTLVTVAIALLAAAMWAHAVAPMMAESSAATQIAPAATRPGTENPDHSLHLIVRATITLSFVLICMILVVGMFATMRSWIKYTVAQKPAREKKTKTQYVDAWKIAGERMDPHSPPDKH